MLLSTCAGCGNPGIRNVLDLGDSPLADEFPTVPHSGQDRYPLGLQHCPKCTMIQLSYVVPDEILWQGDYGFYTGASAAAVDYFDRYARHTISAYGRTARTGAGVLEIACNDGTLLQHFATAGYKVFGVDPASGPVNAARRKGLDVLPMGFTNDIAASIVEDFGTFGLVIANNVIAHVADLDDFVGGIATVLHAEGSALVEFQYGPDLIAGNAYDHVYHEHRSFLTLTALAQILERRGLTAVHAEHTPQQRGSLRVTIEHQTPGSHPDHTVRHLRRAEDWLTDPYALAGMQATADRIRTLLVDMLQGFKLGGKKVAGYGASAKATTLLQWCGIDADLVQYVVDTTPSKHGRYMPGTEIPIISPTADSRRPDVYLLFISNYIGHVMRNERAHAAAGGRWIVPVPFPVVV